MNLWIMKPKVKWTYLLLVLVQGLHSVEEYMGKLWDVFPPARVLCNLISNDLVTGFLIINIGLFAFGLWSWLFIVRKNHSYTAFLIWFWIVLELINGMGHIVWTIVQQAYTPGVWTAPILFVLAIMLIPKQGNDKTLAQQHFNSAGV